MPAAAPTTQSSPRTATASTRDRILEVATRLFTEAGYDKTSLREISDELGVTKAALYYHFKSKDDILRALLEPVIEQQRQLIARIEGTETMEQWAGVLTWMIDQVMEKWPLYQLAHRNQAAVESLAESSEFFLDHLTLHAQIETALTRTEVPLADRVRMICAFGCVAGFDDFGGTLLLEREPNDEIRAELIRVMRSILGVA